LARFDTMRLDFQALAARREGTGIQGSLAARRSDRSSRAPAPQRPGLVKAAKRRPTDRSSARRPGCSSAPAGPPRKKWKLPALPPSGRAAPLLAAPRQPWTEIRSQRGSCRRPERPTSIARFVSKAQRI
jgi:hypothetical protein